MERHARRLKKKKNGKEIIEAGTYDDGPYGPFFISTTIPSSEFYSESWIVIGIFGLSSVRGWNWYFQIAMQYVKPNL